MKNDESCQNIIDYWGTVERFTPYKLDTKNIFGYVKSIQQEVLDEYDIPWKNRDRFEHRKTPDKTWVYNIFIGIINYTDITKLIKTMLESDDEDYNLPTNDQVSCLATFQLNNYGEILSETFAVPEYFISMACLNQRKKYPESWLHLAPKMQQKVLDAYNNWVDVLKNRTDSSVVFKDLQELVTNIINVSDIPELHGCIRNQAVIYSSHIPVPNKFKYDKENGKEKFLNIEYYEEILDTIKTSDLDIINSFYLDDIEIVRNTLSNKKNPIGEGLKDYLGLIPKDKKYDLRKDQAKLEELSNPKYLPSSRWPVSNRVSLSLAQQVSVNLALREDEGIFSVNGPPGTGKSTLLRDIISEIITNRAIILADFIEPKDAFNNPTALSMERYNYKIWSLDPKLLGHEIVIASTNNTAVENISKEIPRLSEVDLFYELNYFSEIANNDKADNDDKCWGIGSAVLGNKKNRAAFFEKFWSKQPSKDENNNLDDKYGLEYLLQNVKPQSDWKENRKRFLSTLAEFTKLKSELIQFDSILKEMEVDNFNNKRYEILDHITRLKYEIEMSETELRDYENLLTQNKETIEHNKYQLKETRKLEPKWYIVLLDWFKKGTIYRNWSDRCSEILGEISRLFEEDKKLKSEILESHTLIAKLKAEVSKLLQKEKELNAVAEKNHEYINLMKNKYSWVSEIPDEFFWCFKDEEMIQLSSPWIHTKLQDLRAKVFAQAMQLHYSFIINASEPILNNMKAIRQVLSHEGRLPVTEELLKNLWGVFFLVVPTVSTTFASFSRLFKGLNSPESLGWLLIDEAGQSAPQEALGAIYRAKKTIVVGDPLQIPPVVTISESINDILLEYYNVKNTWSVLEESVQTLSDRVNIYGTDINDQWVGCPLRVHRRCLEPMFSVANKIAYDDLMIQATPKANSKFDEIYPESLWIDVQSNEFDGHWCKREGEEVFKIIQRMLAEHDALPDLYIISPFKIVAYNMEKLLRDKSKYFLDKSIERDKLNKWINKSVGTIHTFQGKQAEGVILLLGGNPSKPRAINWASKYPNILNVALTRGKYKFFVVGSYKLWATKPHFQVLANAISLTRVSDDVVEIVF